MRINKLKLLLNVELKKYINSNKAKNSLSQIGMFILGFVFLINSIMGTKLLYVYNRELIPYTFSLLTFFFILFSVAGVGYLSLFSEKEYNILFPLPFRDSEIIFGKFMGMYISSLFYIATLLAFPTIYLTLKTNPLFTVFSILLLLVFPAVPLILSLLISMLFSKYFTFKYKKQLGAILGFILVAIIYILIYVFEKVLLNNLLTFLLKFKVLFKLIYFPFNFFERALIEGSILNATVFIILSLGILFIGFYFIEKNYFTLYNKLNLKSKQRLKKKENYKNNSLNKALFKKDLKLYFSSSIYVSNTIVMPITIIIVLILSTFLNNETLDSFSNISNLTEVINSNSLLLLCGFASIAQITYCSLSIEGKNLWISLSLPLKKEDIFYSKIKLGVGLMAIPLIALATVLALRFNQGLGNLIVNLAAALNYSIFANLVGLLYDLNTLNYNWTSEVEVVKQRFSMILVILILSIPLILLFAIESKLSIGSLKLGILLFITVSILNYLLWKKIINKDLYL
ncbi:hypothetical protein [Anaerosphaera multitolerans]|uniref:Uncharacterized protein n=1 Tax=Anaerosphaera multitolerans TaxID=2487351 RepID=A0A437S717_9FIRM|nr:hypothetical protein [Anaerosphaera multitolerans]RVU54806.1 hypothetical protein EF514_05660 [Anaerosphaera multitolerans]